MFPSKRQLINWGAPHPPYQYAPPWSDELNVKIEFLMIGDERCAVKPPPTRLPACVARPRVKVKPSIVSPPGKLG